MAKHTVVIEPCRPETPDEEVSAQVAKMLGKLPGIDERLGRASKIFVKLNMGLGKAPTYRGRPYDCVDATVFAGLAEFIHDRTQAEVLVGDGCTDKATAELACERGHMKVIEQHGFGLLDLNEPPYARYGPEQPAMFRWYELSSALQGVDMTISVAKLKSHGTCGVTLSMKNLFGLPPCPLYGFPRFALHSPIRLPGILADLNRLFPPELCLIDGLVGCNYGEWGGDPVAARVLIAGDNPVATDAVGARYMCVDPAAELGTPPFMLADNHIRLAAQRGLGSLDESDIDLIGEMPAKRKPFSVVGAGPERAAEEKAFRREACQQAQWYFGERSRFVADYQDEIVLLGKMRVLHHAPASDFTVKAGLGALAEAGIEFEQSFCKLVKAEEAELREPYGR